MPIASEMQMLNDADLSASLPEIERKCRDETERFFRQVEHDTRPCYELFRRALAERDAEAFETLMRNYSGLVESWARRYPGFASTSEDAPYFANLAFTKLWTAISPARFSRFPDLKAVLRYLQLCVHSSIIDYLRSVDHAISLDDGGPDGPLDMPQTPDSALSGVERDEIWQAIEARLQNDRERVVLRACYRLAMKPADIPAAYPGTFRTVQEVYRAKQNVLERLSRDASLRRLLAPDP